MQTIQNSHNNSPLPHYSSENHLTSHQSSLDFFSFLKTDKEKHLKSHSFFSENGLSKDILQVTQAEPDICLEAFYALYHTLWPQIEKQPDVSFKDAWTRFIGGAVFKGVLCSPEKLITEKRVRDIKRSLSEEPEGENRIFQDLDGVVNSILNLKQKIEDYSGKISHKKEIIASLSLVQEFYLEFRQKLKTLVQAIIEKEQMNASSILQCEALEDLLEPKAIMMSDLFSHHWAYRIPRNRAQKILSLDASGKNLKSNQNDPSNHRVMALPQKASEPLVFFKANGNPSIQPEKEYMLYNLYNHFQIPVPETGLLILTDVFEANPDYFYAIQASEAVLGESPVKACQDQETIFDHEAYVSQTIGALLTNPSDGSFKNFKYSPKYKTFISIDNDLVFKPEIKSQNTVNVKSMLYLLPQIDLPIPESLKTFFTTLDPHLTILSWLQDLSQKNIEYNLLFTRLAFQKTRCLYQNLLPESEVPPLAAILQEEVLVDSKLHSDDPFYPQILISQNLLNTLTEKLQKSKKVLETSRSVSSQALFEEISPVLGKYYRKLRLKFSDPEEALDALWGDKKNNVDYSEISSLLDHEEFSTLSENKIEFDSNLTRPEPFFKEYKDHLISGTSPLDRFIQRQNQRKKRNILNPRVALKELQFLVQEGFTDSQSPRDIVDFCHSLTKIIENNHLIKEIISLLSNLPHAELKWLFTLEKYFLRGDQSVPQGLITSSVVVLGAFMKKRTFVLTESEKQYLFDEQGSIEKNTFLTGRSSVTCFPDENPEFYLKQYPEWPGYEFASTLFMRLLGVTQLPYQDLIIINNHPVLLTQIAYGDPVFRIWHKSQAFDNLDPVHTGLLIISAMLINPEDGKEDNFILSPDGRYLIPIDNDHCFLPSFFQKVGSFWKGFTVNTALQTKTLLFCLDEMKKSIPLEVKQQILSIEFDSVFSQWMTELDKIENNFNNLAEQSQRNKFLEQGTVMRIPFYKQFIESIHWKAHKIQDILKTAVEPTPFDLLKAVEPFAAKCYQHSFEQVDKLQARFKAATGNLYKKTAIDGSRVSILNTRAMMEIVNISEEELKKDAAFQRMGPVDALELLKKLILERSERAQREQELLCELDEKSQEKKWVGLFGNPPVETALKAFLSNPKEGLVLKGSKLITSSKLIELFAQTPNKGMKIIFLSLPECPLLTDQEIRILASECPNLEYLNVSGCAKLKRIFTAEKELPLLARLEAKDCRNLEKFVSYSPIKILRIGSERVTEIFVEKSTLDIFTVSTREKFFDFSLKAGGDFQMKSGSQSISNNDFILPILRQKDESFRNLKIILGRYAITSAKDLAVCVAEIELFGLDLTNEELQRFSKLKLINLRKLSPLRSLRNRKGHCEHLIQGNWPLLHHLDFSNIEISDEEIPILAKGNWPLLEILNLNNTKIANIGVEILSTQSQWPQLKQICLGMNPLTDIVFHLSLGGNPIGVFCSFFT